MGFKSEGCLEPAMDVMTDAANSVVQQSGAALSVAAGELVKQANAFSQMANSKDALAWLYGEEELEDEDVEALPPLPPAVPVPLAALQPWGSCWDMQFDASQASSSGFHGGFCEPPSCHEPSSSSTAFPQFQGKVVEEEDPLSAPQDGACRGGSEPSRPRTPPFEVDSGLNAKVHLWQGDLCSVEVDALLTPTAAGFTCGASTVFNKVLRHGGKELRADLRHVEGCRSGEARMAKAYGLPSCRLLLTVGPKYKDKYQVAAQNTLNACYRECFQLLVEADLRTIAIPCTWYTKGYPPGEQVHVALRTLRRCLEKLRHAVDAVVLVAAQPAEVELYASLLPLYFPRCPAEAEAAADSLPVCCWHPWGEVSVEERRIRVSGVVRSLGNEDDDDRGAPMFSPDDEADKAFLDCREDADDKARQRLQGTMTEADSMDVARAACLRYIRYSKQVQAETESKRFVYRAGQDRFGRHAVVLLGSRLPPLGIRDERTLPLFVKELEHLKGEKFVLLYVNSGVSAMDASKLEVLQEMLAMISARYRVELAQLLVLHPGLWFRAAFAMGTAVCDATARAWRDCIYVEGVADLGSFFDLAKLELPEYVRAWES